MRSCWRTPSKHSPTRQESHSWAGKECFSRLSLNCIHSTRLENLLDKPIGHHVLRPGRVKALSGCWGERKFPLVDRGHLDPGLWVRVWSRRWKIEASCRSENRSLRPLPPQQPWPTHYLSLPRSRSFLGCSIQRGAQKNTNTQTPRFPFKNAKKTQQQNCLWQFKPVSVSLCREAEELTAAAFLVEKDGWERKCMGTSLVECI